MGANIPSLSDASLTFSPSWHRFLRSGSDTSLAAPSCSSHASNAIKLFSNYLVNYSEFQLFKILQHLFTLTVFSSWENFWKWALFFLEYCSPYLQGGVSVPDSNLAILLSGIVICKLHSKLSISRSENETAYYSWHFECPNNAMFSRNIK